MSASFTISRPDLFPDGTVVKAYPAAQYHGTGKPGGIATSEATASGGTVVLSGLEPEAPYVAWGAPNAVDTVLEFRVDSTPGSLAGTQVRELSPTGGYAFAVYSLSQSEHAFTANMAATGGVGSAVNAVSSNSNFSAVQISGVETSKGTLKISHTNASGTASGDVNAAMISLESHGTVEGGTAVQGIAMKPGDSSSSTGPWLTVRNFAKELLFRVKAEGLTEQKEAAAPPTVEAGCYALYVEGGKLFLKLGAAAAKEITVP